MLFDSEFSFIPLDHINMLFFMTHIKKLVFESNIF